MIQKFQTFITPYGLNRTVHLYLPDNWQTAYRRWPVLYMYDGHNLFYDGDATYGKSWGLKEFLDAHGQPCIVVGVECNHQGYKRLEEYSPYPLGWPENITGTGKTYMDWLVGELKPYIDQNFPTLPGRANTAIGGSSMGGLMSFYSIIAHNRVFSRAICLSGAFRLCPQPLFRLAQGAQLAKPTALYISLGSRESDDAAEQMESQTLGLQLGNCLTAQGARVYQNLQVEGRHCEASWEQELPEVWHWLFEDWENR